MIVYVISYFLQTPTLVQEIVLNLLVHGVSSAAIVLCMQLYGLSPGLLAIPLITVVAIAALIYRKLFMPIFFLGTDEEVISALIAEDDEKCANNVDRQSVESHRRSQRKNTKKVSSARRSTRALQQKQKQLTVIGKSSDFMHYASTLGYLDEDDDDDFSVSSSDIDSEAKSQSDIPDIDDYSVSSESDGAAELSNVGNSKNYGSAANHDDDSSYDKISKPEYIHLNDLETPLNAELHNHNIEYDNGYRVTSKDRNDTGNREAICENIIRDLKHSDVFDDNLSVNSSSSNNNGSKAHAQKSINSFSVSSGSN
jgi:hypothetical protein